MAPMKPLLLIDIDGPLNPYAALSLPTTPEGYTRHRMRPTGWTTPTGVTSWRRPPSTT